MARNAEMIANYNFRPSDELLLDANIWLLVYGPQKPRDSRVTIYSEAFARMLAAESRMYIDVLVISEFINTYARLKWQLLSPASNFKQFRHSNTFKPVARDIAADAKRVLQHCTRVANGFELVATDSLMDEYAAGASDFNDQILTALCKKRGLKLVTDDGDFHGQDISVITANRRLLA